MINSEPLLKINSQMNAEGIASHRSWMERTFSQMSQGSLRSAIFMMLITSLGTGIFTLHHMFSNVGIVMSVVLIIVFGACYYLAADILIHAYTANPDAKTLNELVEKSLGKCASKTFDVIFFVFLVLVMIAGVQSISKNFYTNFQTQIWSFFSNIPETNRNYAYFNFYFAYVIGALLLMINIKRSFDSLKNFSYISLTIFLYIIVVSLVQSPAYYQEQKKKGRDTFNWVNFDLHGIMTNYGLVLFAFNCLMNFFGVVNTLATPSVKRLRKIYFRTFTCLSLLFIGFGFAIYFSLGDQISRDVDLFIFRPSIGSSDYFMQVGRCLLILSLWVNSGLMIYPLKMSIYSALKIENTMFNNAWVSFLFTIIPVIFASWFTNISTLISVAGLTSITITVFTFPGLMAFKIGYVKKGWQKFLMSLWVAGLLAMGIAGAYFVVTN